MPIEPDNGTVTYGRDGFFFHGGERPGSAGCIDLGKYDNAFRELLRGQVGIIPVNISYSIPISEAFSPEEQAQALDDALHPTCEKDGEDGAASGTSDLSAEDGGEANQPLSAEDTDSDPENMSLLADGTDSDPEDTDVCIQEPVEPEPVQVEVTNG